jgi:hypothetical protein
MPINQKTKYWPTPKAAAALGRRWCHLCDGAGWVAVPDPDMDGTLVDVRCPACGTRRADLLP